MRTSFFVMVIVLFSIYNECCASVIDTVWTKTTDNPVKMMKFSSDGKYLYTYDNKCNLQKWDVATGTLIADFYLPENTDFDPDEETYYNCSYANDSVLFKKFDMNTFKTLYSFKLKLSWGDYSIFYAVQDYKTVLCGDNSKVYLFHWGGLGGARGLSGNNGGHICFDSKTGKEITEDDRYYHSGIISREGTYTAMDSSYYCFRHNGSSVEEHGIGVNGRPIRNENGQPFEIIDDDSKLELYSFSNNDSTFLGSYYHTLYVWNTLTGNVIDHKYVYNPHQAIYSSDDRYIYITEDNRLLVLLKDYPITDTVKIPFSDKNNIAVCPVNGLFAIGNSNGSITLYNNSYCSFSLKADFKSDLTDGTEGLKVHFYNMSSGTPDKYLWDFGDGVQSSAVNPVHIYQSPGQYTVKLVASKNGINDTEIKSGYIVIRELLSADFSADRTKGLVPFTVRFQDKSVKNPTTWEWDFGDGTKSNERNPTHLYDKTGLYSVRLTVRNTSDSSTNVKKMYIDAIDKFECNFTESVQSGTAPLEVCFGDKSEGGPSEFFWDFGDGVTSNQKNPVHFYDLPGVYDVKLVIRSGDLADSLIKPDLIEVTAKASSMINLNKSIIAHNSSITGMAYSADGRTIVSSSLDKTVRIWDAGNLSLVKELVFNAPVISAYISCDDKYLLTASLTEKADSLAIRVSLFDFTTYGLIKETSVPSIRKNKQIPYCYFDENPNTNEFLLNYQEYENHSKSGNQVNKSYVWLTGTDTMTAGNSKANTIYNSNGSYFFNCRFENTYSQDQFNGNLFNYHIENDYSLTGKSNHTYENINWTNQAESSDTTFRFVNPVICRFSPAGDKLLLSYESSGHLHTYLTIIGDSLTYKGYKELTLTPANDYIFDRTGKYLIGMDINGKIYFIDTENDNVFTQQFYSSSISNWIMDNSPDRDQFVTGSSDGKIRLWSYDSPGSLSDELQTESGLNFAVQPNPAADYFTLSVFRNQPGNISISLTDLLGNRIRSVYSGQLEPGNHNFIVNCNAIEEGVYFVNLYSGNIRKTAKVLIIK